MSKQILSIEQMQHLQELGLDTSNASASWYKPDMDTEYMLMFGHLKKEELVGNEESIPSYTLQDVMDMLPKGICPFPSHRIVFELWIGSEKIFYANMFNLEDVLKARYDKELIDAAYELLVWCVEQGYVETDKKD